MRSLRHTRNGVGEMRKFLNAAKRALIVGASILLGVNGILMILIATLQITSRALGHPVAWTVELLLFLGLYSIIPGTAVSFLRGEEVEIDFFVNLLPNRLSLWLARLVALVGVVFGAMLIASTLKYREIVVMAKPEQYLPLPPEANIWPLYLLGLCIAWRMAEKLLGVGVGPKGPLESAEDVL